MFDWNCQIFQRTNRRIIKVTQTPLKSLYLLGRNKKKSVHLQSDILPGKPTKQWENFQFLLSMLFPYEKQGTVWGPLPWDSDQHPALQASPVSLLLTVPLDPTQSCIPYWPAWLLFLHVWSFPWKLWFIQLLSKGWSWLLLVLLAAKQDPSFL